MFDSDLDEQFARLQAEHGQALYRYYALTRQLDALKQDIERMEAGLYQLERVKKSWETEKAIDQAQAKKDK